MEGKRSRADLAAYYERLLDEQKRSGLSVVEFAKEVGVSSATLYSWRRRLGGGRGDRPSDGALVEVHVTDQLDPAALPAPMVLSIDGRVRIELEESFDEGALERLLSVLARC